MKKVSREKIVDVASKLIETTGSTDVTLSAIADALSITHGALYKHFDSKQDLWEAVASQWFQTQIMDRVMQKSTRETNTKTVKIQLHNWLWNFVSAKKDAYLSNPQMFTLNTRYVDNNPLALRRVLTPAYAFIDELMDYHDPHFERAETILASLSVFTLPNFKETWEWPDYEPRFEAMWALIEPGV